MAYVSRDEKVPEEWHSLTWSVWNKHLCSVIRKLGQGRICRALLAQDLRVGYGFPNAISRGEDER